MHSALVERLEHDTPIPTINRLFDRHGRHKVQPDIKHPKSDPTMQDEFKRLS
jgi:hypothetical protein